MADNKIQITIAALDNTKAAFAALEQSLRGVGEQTATAQRVSSGHLAKMKENWMALSATAVAAFVAIQKAMQYINQGAAALRAEEAFAAMADAGEVNAARLSAAMKKAADGMIDDSDLMQRAAFAMAQDIDPEKIPQLLEAARIAARKTGRDFGEAVDSMVQGIATNMPRGLRSMGAITKEQMGLLNKAVAAGVDDINLLDLVLANAAVDTAKFGASANNAAKDIKRFQVQAVELKEEVGKYLITGLQKLMGAFQGVAGAAMSATIPIARLLQLSNELAASGAEKIGKKDWAEQWRKKAQGYADYAGAAEGASNELYKRSLDNMYGSEKTADTRTAEQKATDIADATAKRDKIVADIKKAVAAATGKEGIAKLREEWVKTVRELDADIAKTGLDEFENKLIDIDKKVLELQERAQKLPTALERKEAGEKIETWKASTQSQAGAEAAWKDFEEEQKRLQEGKKAREDLEKELTAAQASELGKRLLQVDEWTKKERSLAVVAYAGGAIDAQTYQQKLLEIEKVALTEKEKLQDEHNRTIREAAIGRQLAELDIAEAAGIPHAQTLTERIRLTKELQSIQEAFLATVDRLKDPTGWNTQQKAIDETRLKLLGLNNDLTAATGTMGEGLSKGWTDWINNARSTFTQGKDLATTTADSMKSSFSNIFFDSWTGNLQSAGDYFKSFAQTILRALANTASEMIVKWLMVTAGATASTTSSIAGITAEMVAVQALIAEYYALAAAKATAGIVGAVTSVAGAASGAGYAIAPTGATGYGGAAGGYHGGGEVGKPAAFYRIVLNPDLIPRRHGGGLAPDERMTINKVGERFITKEQNDWLSAMSRKMESGQAAPEVKIDIANIVSPDLLDAYLATGRGQNAMLNFISSKSGTIKRIMGSS